MGESSLRGEERHGSQLSVLERHAGVQLGQDSFEINAVFFNDTVTRSLATYSIF
jgi:hypothetical protein